MKGRTTRNICFAIENRKFSCQDVSKASVVIPSDQMEALRLVDVEGKSQIEAAAIMGISRGTIQRLCIKARKAIATSLIYGYDIVILLVRLLQYVITAISRVCASTGKRE